MKNDDNKPSPRFLELGELLKNWIDKYPDEDFSEDNGLELIILGFDKKYNDKIAYSIVDSKDPLKSVFDVYNRGLGKVFDPGHDVEQEIFYGVLNWYCKVFSMFPDLYERFKYNVELNINDKE